MDTKLHFTAVFLSSPFLGLGVHELMNVHGVLYHMSMKKIHVLVPIGQATSGPHHKHLRYHKPSTIANLLHETTIGDLLHQVLTSSHLN